MERVMVAGSRPIFGAVAVEQGAAADGVGEVAAGMFHRSACLATRRSVADERPPMRMADGGAGRAWGCRRRR